QRLIDGLVAAAGAIKVGRGTDAGVQMGPLATRAQLEKVMSYIEIAHSEGARVAAGGWRITEAGFERGHFVRPTVFVDVPRGSRLLREEIFGPAVAVRGFASLDEAI